MVPRFWIVGKTVQAVQIKEEHRSSVEPTFAEEDGTAPHTNSSHTTDFKTTTKEKEEMKKPPSKARSPFPQHQLDMLTMATSRVGMAAWQLYLVDSRSKDAEQLTGISTLKDSQQLTGKVGGTDAKGDNDQKGSKDNDSEGQAILEGTLTEEQVCACHPRIQAVIQDVMPQ